MKRSPLIAFFALIALLTFAVPAGPREFHPLVPGALDGGMQLEITRMNPDGLHLAIRLDGFHWALAETPEGAFSEIAVEGAGLGGLVGQAALPVVRQTIQIPIGAVVLLEVQVQETTALDLEADLGLAPRILPVQEPRPKCPDSSASVAFRYDPEYFLRETPDPATSAQVVETGMIRGARFATIELHPVRYLPAAGRIEIATRTEVEIVFEDGDMPATRRESARFADARFETYLSRLLPNHGVFQSTAVPQEPGGYLIVAADQFADDPSLAAFADWKRRMGYHVTVLSTADTGRDAWAIGAWIQNAYDAWEIPPAYVLLVGDTNAIGYFPGRSRDRPATDLYYATTAGSDYLPDLWIGRLPVASETQLANALNKITAFEQALWPANPGWEQSAVFISSEDRFFITETTHNHVINTFLDGAGYASDRLYSHTYNASAAQIENAVNAGRSLVVYSGHGDVTFWVDPFFDKSHISGLHNVVHPLVQSYACLTGQFEANESFGEAWIRSAGGAAAFWGASVSSYWDEDDVMERAVFHAFFANPDDAVNLTWIGAMLDYGKMAVRTRWGNTDDVLLYFEMYNTLGDPSLDVWTAPPAQVFPTHDTEIAAETQAINVNVPGQVHALVGLSMNGVRYGGAFTDGAGNALVPIMGALTQNGQMDLTVTGHNLAPYFGTVDVRVNSFSLDSFTATGGAQQVEVEWSASGEEDARGYHLEQAISTDGAFERITPGEIPASSGSYTFTDEDLEPSTTYWYRLEVIDHGGASAFYGPIDATTSEDEPVEDDEDGGGNGCGR